MIEWTRKPYWIELPLVHLCLKRAVVALLFAFAVTPANAHPHVFVDGGVDFRFDDQGRLEALEVTWLYDEFETLYILSSHGLSLNSAGGLDEIDRQRLVAFRSEWPEDFDGSAHLSLDGAAVALNWPTGLDGSLVDGRLRLTFERVLETPIDLRGRDIEVAFYESTYFFAFSISQTPKLIGAFGACDAQVVYFEANTQDTALQNALRKLSREETPAIANVGSLFADRVTISCG